MHAILFNQFEYQVHVAPPFVKEICDKGVYNLTDALDKASEHREILESVLELLDVEITNETNDDLDDLFHFDYRFCEATQVLIRSLRKEVQPLSLWTKIKKQWLLLFSDW